MKHIYWGILFLIIICTSCKKEHVPSSEETLIEMKQNIINDWKIYKIIDVKPAYMYGTIVTSPCEGPAEFSFRTDGTFNYKGNPNCYSLENIPGVWDLHRTDSLFINFIGNWIIGAYEKLEVTKLTADTMKWNILASTGNGNPVITQEYTLIPK